MRHNDAVMSELTRPDEAPTRAIRTRVLLGLPLCLPLAGAAYGVSEEHAARNVGVVVALQIAAVVWMAIRRVDDLVCRRLGVPGEASYVVAFVALSSLGSLLSDPSTAVLTGAIIAPLLAFPPGRWAAIVAWSATAAVLSLIAAVLMVWIVGFALIPVAVAAWRTVGWQLRMRR